MSKGTIRYPIVGLVANKSTEHNKSSELDYEALEQMVARTKVGARRIEELHKITRKPNRSDEKDKMTIFENSAL